MPLTASTWRTQVPRALWRRRRTTDSPRPAGRRWAGRLRRSGSLARRVLLVGRRARRRTETGGTLIVAELPDAHDPARRSPRRLATRPAVPVSPAVPAPAGGAPAGPMSIPLLPGERTPTRRVYFALVTGCTLSSLLLGVSAIFMAVNHVGVHWAALCLLACVAFDGLGGALGRRLGVASPFGAQMDSLADMCAFGVAAPVVVYAWLAGSAPAALIVPACALV